VDLSRYKRLFLSEATEHLRTLDRGLVTLERDPSDTKVLDEIFRSAHSIKGMAGAMQYDHIQTIAHALEDLLEPMRRQGRIVDGAVDVLLHGVDAIRGILSCIEQDRPSEVDVGAVLARVRRFRRGEDEPGASNAPAGPGGGAPSSGGIAMGAPGGAPPVAAEPGLGAEAPAGARRMVVWAEVSPASSSPAVRAFIVYRKLSALGRVASIAPSVEAIRAGEFRGKLKVDLFSVVEPDGVKQVLASIPDLLSFSVRAVDDPEEDVPEVEPAMPPPPAPLPVPPRPPASLERGAGATVRVRTQILDRFMDSLADLLIAKSRLREVVGRNADREVVESLAELERSVREVHDRVMELRLLPVSHLTERLPRMVRDLAVRRGKRVRLEVTGADVEIDRAVVEALDSPFVHLVRNAVDHGIEAPEERLVRGKAADGLLRVSARRDRGEVVLEVADDGRGIDPQALREVALLKGLLSRERLGSMDDREALQLICLPGLTTASEVSDLSGRGVGMDVVKTAVENLGGSLEIASELGVGTRFVLRLPLTVAVLSVLAVSASAHVHALPLAKVERTALAGSGALRVVGKHLYYAPDEDTLIPVYLLAELLGFQGEELLRAPLPLVLVAGEDGLAALAVDGFWGARDVVLRPLGTLLGRVAGLSGVVLMGDGRPSFLLDAAELVRGAEPVSSERFLAAPGRA
jgi:two-component system chemotaxis sensor kinase CheA